MGTVERAKRFAICVDEQQYDPDSTTMGFHG